MFTGKPTDTISSSTEFNQKDNPMSSCCGGCGGQNTAPTDDTKKNDNKDEKKDEKKTKDKD